MIYKIGDIAKVMGVTTEAIRHYERMGLIKPEKDPQTNYRYFTEEQLSQLHTYNVYHRWESVCS